MTDAIDLDGLLELANEYPMESTNPFEEAGAELIKDLQKEMENAAPTGEASPGRSREHSKTRQERKEKKRERREKRKRRKEKKARRENKERGDKDEGEEGINEGEDDERDMSSDFTDEEDDQIKRSKYVLDAAESGESEDDDFVESGEEDFDEINIPRYEPQGRFIFQEGEEELTAEELAKQIEERDRYHRSRAKHEGGVGASQTHMTREMLSSMRYAPQLLPQDTDPKVFAVKCRPRMARTLVARIVNKCYAYRVGKNFERKKVDLGIISAFCVDHVKDYIYIEAHRKIFVENALNGLEGVFRFSISLVNPSELLQMMEQRPSNEKLLVGSFVRLRQGFYRSDIAQVVKIHRNGIHITCKVVPREDFIEKLCNKPSMKLAPKFFVPNLALGVERRDDGYRWGNLLFDSDGYLLKTTSTRMVISGTNMKRPTTEELALFFKNNREQVIEAAMHNSTPNAASLKDELRIGDSVRVVRGELCNTVGFLVNIFTNNGTGTLACPVPGQDKKLNLRIELASCVKHFVEGAHVVVEAGEYAGESGNVVHCEGELVHIFPDRSTTSREIKVRANDCHLSKLTGSFGHTMGEWKLYDLVLLSEGSCAACIISFHRNGPVVVTERNERRSVVLTQIKAAPQGSRKTTDQFQNLLSRGVEIIFLKSNQTPPSLIGQTGRIEQVFNNTIFIRCRSILKNSGVLAIDAGCVQLLGGRATTKQQTQFRQLPVPIRAPHNATRANLNLSSLDNSATWQVDSEWWGSERH